MNVRIAARICAALAALWVLSSPAMADCSGQFPANYVCGTGASADFPGPIPTANINSIDVFAIGGQSLAQGQSGDANLSPRVPTGKVLQYTGTYVNDIITSGSIVDANDPVGTANTSSAWPAFGINYVAATGRKIMFVSTAHGGTDQCATTGASTLNWDTSGTLAPALVANVNSAMAAARTAGYTPVYRGILWSQGENDAGAISNNATFPTFGFTTITGGPYAAGTTVITVASATGVAINNFAVITLDNGTTYTSVISNVVGTTVTLTTAVPTGRSILNNAVLTIYSQAMYRACLRNMISYFRSTTTDGTTFPNLPFYISLTGAPSTGDQLGYQKVRQAQDQVAASDPTRSTRVAFRGAVDFIALGMMQAASLHYTQQGWNMMGAVMAQSVVSAQTSDGWLHTPYKVAQVALGGTLRNGDQLTITVTSTAISGSPWVIGPVQVVLPGDTFTSVAARQADNGNLFSPNLAAVGMSLTSQSATTGSYVNVYYPETLSPVPVVTASWITGGATETVSVTVGDTAYGWSPNMYYTAGAVTVGATGGGLDALNVFPLSGSKALGAYGSAAAGSDNNLLRVANTVANTVLDQRAGILLQPALGGLGSTYGSAIISQHDQSTGRGNLIFGGYAVGTFIEAGRWGYNEGLCIGSACGTIIANGGTSGDGHLNQLGATSGFVDVHPQAVAGTPNIAWPTGSGTVVTSASGNTSLNTTTGALTGAANGTTNAMLATMTQSTVKGRAAGAGTGDPTDLTLAQLYALVSPAYIESPAITVNFGSANTDNAIALPTLPTGFTRWKLVAVQIAGASANISAATFGVFSTTGGGGVALVTSGTACTVTATAEDTAANSQQAGGISTVTITPGGSPSPQFRVQTAAASGTAKVTAIWMPLS